MSFPIQENHKFCFTSSNFYTSHMHNVMCFVEHVSKFRPLLLLQISRALVATKFILLISGNTFRPLDDQVFFFVIFSQIKKHWLLSCDGLVLPRFPDFEGLSISPVYNLYRNMYSDAWALLVQ